MTFLVCNEDTNEPIKQFYFRLQQCSSHKQSNIQKLKMKPSTMESHDHRHPENSLSSLLVPHSSSNSRVEQYQLALPRLVKKLGTH